MFHSMAGSKIFLMNLELKFKNFQGMSPFKWGEGDIERRGPCDITVLATTGWMYQNEHLT